jgi:hypothetical protein
MHLRNMKSKSYTSVRNWSYMPEIPFSPPFSGRLQAHPVYCNNEIAEYWLSDSVFGHSIGRPHCPLSGVEFKNDKASFRSPTHINGDKQGNRFPLTSNIFN